MLTHSRSTMIPNSNQITLLGDLQVLVNQG